jgi:CO dehydrogenase maturation factor
MNPKVDDIPDKCLVEHEGIRLMSMGTIRTGGGGCACPESAFIKQLLSHLVLQRDEVVIMDMEAGIEHLGRGTATGVDRMLVVVEPSRASLDTAARIRDLAGDIGIGNISIAGNNVRSDDERDYITQNAACEVLGFIDHSEDIRAINTGRKNIHAVEGKPLEQVRNIIEKLEDV